ncbi:helix-turn-helix domain-containing protein [Pseudokineococcus lusitanus]|uniref:helix-turn-helix domain-containing protein n=1 Tax=Pseudokineococcus lusitanus TaxID=763993 RepID=UPI000F476675
MSTVTPLPRRGSARDLVAGQVRAELARARISVRSLGNLLGQSSAYWSRRATGQTAFDVDDLEQLAGLLNVPVGYFVGAVDARGPRPDGPDGGQVASECAAPDSNREPTD